MKKLITLLIITTFIMTMFPSMPNKQALAATTESLVGTQSDVTKDYLVGFKNTSGKEKVQNKGKSKHEFKYASVLLTSLTEAAKEELLNDPEIEYIEPDAPVQANSLETETVSWGYNAIEVDKAHQTGYFGQGVKIAILDSGVDINHPDLQTEAGISFVNDSYQDDNGHGTQVTGIINAQLNALGVKGVSPLAKIHPVKILNQNGQGTYSGIIKGIEWALDNGIDIISMSFGGQEPSKSLEREVDLAAKKGLLLIAAAGNLGNNGIDNLQFPARYTSVVAVGSFGQQGNISTFSSNGPELDLLAPGEDILTTQVGGGYSYASGTSIATPHVTALAALVKGTNSKLKAQDIKDIIVESSLPVINGGVKVINAFGALELALKSSTPKNNNNKIERKIDYNNSAKTLQFTISQPGSVLDYVYGYSPEYGVLKKLGKLDKFGKIGKDGQLTKEDEELLQLINQANTNKETYNTLTGPSTTNGVKEEKYSSWSGTSEIVSPYTGDLTIKNNDITLPGKNGLDLSIGRFYQSNQALFGDRKVISDTVAMNDYSTYFLNRYNLGLGWSFSFPSVQVEEDGFAKELYYHNGSGAVYHVNFTSDPSDSNLEKYYTKDAVFNQGDTSFTNGQVTSYYVFQTADGTKEYFAMDGRLMGIKNRYGDTITFKHTEKAVSNIAPNNDFEYAENQQIWANDMLNSYDQTFGKDDDTSIKFERLYQTVALSSSISKYIEVIPSKKYTVSGYIYNQLSSGNVGLSIIQFDQDHVEIHSNWVVSTTTNTWEYLSSSFTTSSLAKYVKIAFSNQNASGRSWTDKVRLDRAWPLISEVTDTVGRTVYFNYNYSERLYEDNPPDGGTVTATVYDPSMSNSKTLTYTRGPISVLADWRTWTEERRYPRLFSFNDGEIDYYYQYNIDKQPQVYLSAPYSYWTKTPDTNSGNSPQLLLMEVYLRNSRVLYNYQTVRKYLGANGFYDVYRIATRYEQPVHYDPNTHEYYFLLEDEEYKKTYSYSGSYNGNAYDNETGYHASYGTYQDAENPNYLFTITMQQNNQLIQNSQLIKKETFGGGKSTKAENINTSGGITYTDYYDSYDSRFPFNITQLRSVRDETGKGTSTTYIGYSYNDWGGLATETKPLTSDQWNDPSVKNQYTTSYEYDQTYKFITKRSFYQSPSVQQSVYTIYDSQGRLSYSLDAKGQRTDYLYDTVNPSLLIRTEKPLEDGRTAIIEFDYTGGYQLYPTKTTERYSENGQAKTSETNKQYEFIRGNITSLTDALGHITSYQYDTLGRNTRITYPTLNDKDGNNYTIEDVKTYFSYDIPPEINMALFLVKSERTKTIQGGQTSVVSRVYNYYDDHGNLLLNKEFNFDTGSWVNKTYSYNDYGQLISFIDANGHQTTYQSDEWNRLKEIIDAQSNQLKNDYDTINRTKTTYFLPNAGVAENHVVETYDQWGRLISQKGYPDGISGSTIEERYEYDIAGNVTKQIDARNNEVNFQYDALNQLVKVTNALGEVVDYDYNRLGELTKSKQYQGSKTFETSISYDERGVLISKQRPTGPPVTQLSNALGLPIQSTDASGKIKTIQYDNLNRPQKTEVTNDGITAYYNALGAVEKYDVWNDSTGARLSGEALEYDFYSLGFVKQRKNSTFAVQFEYDSVGNRTKVTDPFNLSTDYTYDSLNRVQNITVAGGTPDSRTFTYEYFADGMIKAVNYPNNLIRAEYTYDNLNRLGTFKNFKNGQLLLDYTYTYDNNGNIISVVENGQTTTYQYDVLNRLVGIQRPSGENITYEYDTRGNRIQMGGYSTTFSSGEFNFNSWDELSSFTVSGIVYNYYYDAEGLRSRKLIPSGTTRYHYDNNGRVVAESDANNNVTAQIVWGHKALLRKMAGVYYYYVYNGHGDVVQVLDESGNVKNSYSYDEWGNILSKTEQVSNPLKYTGEYFDDESGFYYLRARYYDPAVGRFISEDSVAGEVTNPLSLNLYTYTYNNPLIYFDPSGHVVTDWDKAHLTPDEQKTIQQLTDQWYAAPAEERAGIHNQAESIRNKYRGENEIGSPSKDGQTVDKYTGAVLGGSPVVNESTGDKLTTVAMGIESVRKGEEFAKKAHDYWGTSQNYESIETSTGSRIPDAINKVQKFIGEAKGKAYQSLTRQLRGMMDWGQENMYRFELAVPEGAVLSKRLREAIDAIGGKVIRLPSTLQFNIPQNVMEYFQGKWFQYEG